MTRATRPTLPEPTERQIQRAVAEVLDLAGVLWTHVPNEGRRDGKTGKLMKAAGMKAGVPDVLIFDRPPKFPQCPGIAIELKRRGGRSSDAQKQWLTNLHARGWIVVTSDSVDHALDLLRRCGYIK